MNLHALLAEIAFKGHLNRMAIQTGKDIRAGKRGATGRNERKSEVRGIACPKRKYASSHDAPPLPVIKTIGTPLKCSGPKPDGDGYRRDKYTGVITRC